MLFIQLLLLSVSLSGTRTNPFLGRSGFPTTRCACCACNKSGRGSNPTNLGKHVSKTMLPQGAFNGDHKCYATPCENNPGKYCWQTEEPEGGAWSTAVSCAHISPPFDESRDCGYATCSSHHLTDKCACCACNKKGAGGGFHSCRALKCKGFGPKATNMKTGKDFDPFCWSPLLEDGGTDCHDVLSEDAGLADCRACLDDGQMPPGVDSLDDDAEAATLRADCSTTRNGCGPKA